MNKETCYVQSSVVLVFFFHNCELSQYNLLDTQWKKKLRNDCLSSFLSSFSFSFFLSWPFLSTFYVPTSRIDYTYIFFLLCRFIIQILMRCLVPCVWTSSTKLGRHYMISQIFLRASSLNSLLIPIPQIRSMGTQQPCIFTGMNVKKSWMMISDCSVLNSGSFRPCKICYLQNFLILKNLWSYFSHFSRYFF